MDGGGGLKSGILRFAPYMMILTCTRLYTCMVYTLYTGLYTIYMTIKTCTVPLCICIWCILYTIRAFKTSRQLLEFRQLLQVSPLATSRTITNTCQQTNSKSYNVLQNVLFALEISNDGFPCSNIIYSIVKYFVSSYIDFTTLVSKTRQCLLLFVLKFTRVSPFPFAILNSTY